MEKLLKALDDLRDETLIKYKELKSNPDNKNLRKETLKDLELFFSLKLETLKTLADKNVND